LDSLLDHRIFLVSGLCLHHYQCGFRRWQGYEQTTHPEAKLELKKLAVVSAGGITGSLSRWGLSLVIVDHGFPWATLFVNFLGSVLLMVIVLIAERPAVRLGQSWWWRPAIGAGFCGGFTTYSAFAVQMDQYLTAHQLASALTYSLVSIIGTMALLRLTHRIFKSKQSNQIESSQPE